MAHRRHHKAHGHRRYRGHHEHHEEHRESGCYTCGHHDFMPFICKRCGRKFCGDHRLPENHKCEGLVRGKWPQEFVGVQNKAFVSEPHVSYESRVPNKYIWNRRSQRHWHFPRISIPWWGWIAIIVLIYIALIKIHIPYAYHPLSDPNLYCQNENLMMQNNMMGLGQMVSSMMASVTCLEFKSSACQMTCKDEKPACHCEASIFDVVFSTPGEWMLNIWR